MNKIKLFFSFFAILFVVASCNPEPELPVVLFEDAEKGAYPRLLNFDGVFNFLDVDNSFAAWEVEFYDEDNGSHVTEYSWTVAYRDNSGNGGSRGEVPLATIPVGSFGTSANGLPGTSATWTMTEVLDAFGFTIDSINGGDAFNFFATLKRDDGKEFNTVNTGDAIEGSAPFSGFFRFTMNVVCPSELEGVMDVSTVGWCGDTWEGEIEWVNEGNGVYNMAGGVGDMGQDFSFGAYFACYSPTSGLPNANSGNVRFTDSCNKLGYQGTSQWGEAYYINNLTVDGANLTIDWFNDYAPEAGVTTFTRQDGKDWPALTF